MNLDLIYIFKVRDYSTILLGQYDADNDCYFVQRGDGEKYVYDAYRIIWKRKLECETPKDCEFMRGER